MRHDQTALLQGRQCRFTLRPRFCVLICTIAASPLQGADLLHQFDLDGSLDDTLATGVSLTVHPNTETESFGVEGWSWTASSSPGGGLILITDQLSDPLDYSLGFRVRFSQVAAGGGGGGSAYRKLVSFKGPADDDGLYFLDAHLVFYPFGANNAVTYEADTFYDFVFSRSAADDKIRVFVVEADGTVTKVYEEDDPGYDAAPLDLGGGSYLFMLFMDDTATAGEWTGGGVCRGVRVWDGPLAEEEVSDALSSVATGAATDVTDDSATLNGTVNPGGSTTTVTFEIGTTTAYGTEVTADQSPVDGTADVAVSKAIDGLTGATTYHYRVKAVGAGGTTYGGDRTFTTLVEPNEITASGGSATYTLAGSPGAVDAGITVTGPAVIDVRVSITANFVVGDVLSYTGALPGGVSASYNATSGILTFTGTADAADWQALLRTVTFATTSTSTLARTVSFTLGGAIPLEHTGHFYEFIADTVSNWTVARDLAAARTLFGLQGYLATITSAQEQDFITAKVSGVAWIGATDAFTEINTAVGSALYANQAASEGRWYWVTGPEAGTQISTSNFPSAAFNDAYLNWNDAEPNNAGASEHYGHMMDWTTPPGRWNDVPNAGGGGIYAKQGYVVEYGGMPGDPVVQITTSRTVSVTATPPPPAYPLDQCPADPAKLEPGICGCGAPDNDSDGDETPDCLDQCPQDPDKLNPGLCGCGTPETDQDGDGVPDCRDACPLDSHKIRPGLAGCGILEDDSDGDGVPDATDGCPHDPLKVHPGTTGCGVAELDSDGDGNPDSVDACPDDPRKTAPGSRGCGMPEQPDLQVNLTFDLPGQNPGFQVGDLIRGRVLVANIGGGGASNVWVIIPLPVGMQFVSLTVGLIASGQAAPEDLVITSDQVLFRVGDVPAGHHVTADLILRASASGTLSITPQTISEETPQRVPGPPADARVGNIDDRIVTTTYPALCGLTGTAPLILTALALALMGRRRMAA